MNINEVKETLISCDYAFNNVAYSVVANADDVHYLHVHDFDRGRALLKRRLIIPPELPPFLSRENDAEGNARELSRDMARRIIKDAFARAGIVRVTDA